MMTLNLKKKKILLTWSLNLMSFKTFYCFRRHKLLRKVSLLSFSLHIVSVLVYSFSRCLIFYFCQSFGTEICEERDVLFSSHVFVFVCFCFQSQADIVLFFFAGVTYKIF